ncbi:MAG: hypothetical protein Q9227_002463 [Pyrenula ochraceoflavens]
MTEDVEKSERIAKDVETGVAHGLEAENAVPLAPTKETLADEVPNGTKDHPNSSSASTATEEKEEQRNGNALEKTASQAEKLGGAKTFVIMFSLCTALFLAALDMTIITTALPVISGHFKASESSYTWVGSAYLLACAATVPLWGKLSDIWGRKPIIMMANLVFMLGSLICALSVSIGMLLVGRAVQGGGGGGLVVLVNICVSDLFSQRERAKYFGIVGMIWALASAVGPVLGGVFTQRVSWRWCFYINLPLDGCAFLLLLFFLSIETPKTPLLDGLKSIDWIGVITIVGGVVMFLFGLESGGQTHPWDSAFTLCLIIFGVITIGIFLVNETFYAKYPIMPTRLFRRRSNCAALLTCAIQGFTFISGSYFLPVYFQTVLSATPILSGVYLFPYVVSLSIMSGLAGVTIKRTGRYKEQIWAGMLLMTLGFGLFIDLPPHASWARVIIYQIIAGIGVGPNFQSPLIALQSTVKPADIATATATFGFVRQLSTSLSVVLGGVVFENTLDKKRSQLRQALGPQVAGQLSASGAGSSTSYLRTLPQAQKQIVNRAYTDSLQKMWIFYTVFAAVGFLVSLGIVQRTLSTTHEKAKTGLEEQERARKEQEEEDRQKKEKRRSLASPNGVAEEGMARKSVEAGEKSKRRSLMGRRSRDEGKAFEAGDLEKETR